MFNSHIERDASLPEGPLPLIPGTHASNTYHFDYAIYQGKIYIRSTTPEAPKRMERGELKEVLQGTPGALEWSLFDNIGVPFDKYDKSLLKPGEQIVRIFVASEIVVAVSNNKQVYLYKPTELKRPLYWENYLGSPDVVSNKLFIPSDTIDIAFSCSVCKKDEIRRTDFIHPAEIVKYFSDANYNNLEEMENGIRFDFGFTPTLFVLLKGGQKIVYWDTGLPPSFSRGFLVPDGMRALSISAAGSTIFICTIDDKGALHYFTRMLDYEINGACPGLKVSYIETPRIDPPEGPDSSFFLGQGIRKNPLTGWVEHPVGDLFTTDKIRIRLTGEGDKARDLIILGQDLQEGWGYYSKNISETQWTFIPDPTAEPTQFEENKSDITSTYEEKKNTYAGRFYDAKTKYNPLGKIRPGIKVELTHFHPFITDSDEVYLVIHSPGEEPQPIRIYIVDGWGLHYHQYDERLFGTVDGEPKPLLGTLVLTNEQQVFAENANTPLADFLKNQILPYHGKTKEIGITADNCQVTLRLGENKCRVERKVTAEEIYHSFYMKRAMNKKLTAIPQNPKECDTLIAINKKCLEKIESIFSKRKLRSGLNIGLHAGARPLRKIIVSVFKFIYAPQDPTYEQAAYDIRKLFSIHLKSALYACTRPEDKAPGYMEAKRILNKRLNALENMKKNFKKRPVIKIKQADEVDMEEEDEEETTLRI